MSADWRQASLPDGVTARMLLVRHGETVPEARGICYGRLDVALSRHGVEQIRRAADLLSAFEPDRIVSSPRVRALDSARLIGAACHLEVGIESDFAELDFGDLEGMRYEEAARSYPDFYAAWMASPTEVTFPNGESYAAMSRRVAERYAACLADSTDKSTVLVAHGGVIRIILAQALQLEPGMVFRLEQSYAAISCIDYYESTPLVRVMNWLP